MTNRLEQITSLAPRNDGSNPININPFIDSPAEFLVKQIALAIRDVQQFKDIFGQFIDPYPRDDYGVRNLPALRIYNHKVNKAHESWFITGDILMDIILPASLRRSEHQEIPDVISHALLQQFRRPSFFNQLCNKVPGLNELGKTFNIDKDLAFRREEEFVPLTQIQLNFRIDLREWDDYLIQTDRTKDSPFDRILGDLERIAGIIQGLKDNDEVNIEISTDQEIGE